MAKTESKYLATLREKCKASSLVELSDELKTTNILLFAFHLLGIAAVLFTYISFANHQYAAGTFLLIAVIFVAGLVSVGQDTKAVVKEYIAKRMGN